MFRIREGERTMWFGRSRTTHSFAQDPLGTLLRCDGHCYGEKGLPGNATHFSLHPASWRPDDSGVRTRVSILFETDGTSRDHPEGSPTNTTYELRRTVTTVAAKPDRPGESDFR